MVGGGDWSKNRLIPDCAKSWSKGQTVILRNPNSTRPWQHVLEPLCGYLKLAEKLYYDNTKKYTGSWNFGPNKRNNLKVKETIFIDDLKENTAAANRLGIHTWNLIPGQEDVTQLFTKKQTLF